jgi:hypothetical protein
MKYKVCDSSTPSLLPLSCQGTILVGAYLLGTPTAFLAATFGMLEEFASWLSRINKKIFFLFDFLFL